MFTRFCFFDVLLHGDVRHVASQNDPGGTRGSIQTCHRDFTSVTNTFACVVCRPLTFTGQLRDLFHRAGAETLGSGVLKWLKMHQIHRRTVDSIIDPTAKWWQLFVFARAEGHRSSCLVHDNVSVPNDNRTTPAFLP